MPKSLKVGLIKKYMLCLHVRVPPKNRNGKNASLELNSLHQTIKGDPNDGLNSLEPKLSYLIKTKFWLLRNTLVKGPRIFYLVFVGLFGLEVRALDF